MAVALLGAVLGAQAPTARAAPPAKPEGQAQQPPRPRTRSDQVFRARADLVTTDVIVRDSAGEFVADLKKEDFEVFEDEVKQELVSFMLSHGGRIFNVAAPPPQVAEEGIILPAVAPDQRCRRADLPGLRRRPAPGLPQHSADPGTVQEDREGTDPRRRHVRHRLHRSLVAGD